MLSVEVVYCPQPGQIDSVALNLPEGATLREALAASGLLPRHGLSMDTARVGVWCREKPLDTVLRERDRIEIYRPLTVDPKEARRQRYRRDRAPREDIAGRLPMFVPETIQADWNNMWRSVGHGETKDVWGGTVVRYANQVTYRSPGECQRGCTFSMLDNPMAVAGRVQSIRKYWEEQHTLPLNGDTRGIEQDPWARNMRPVTPNNNWAKSLQYSTDMLNRSLFERTKGDDLTTWAK